MATATMAKPKKRVGKKRFKLLIGSYQGRCPDGTMGEDKQGVVYNANGEGAGNIIETEIDLCHKFNSQQRGLQPKFERLDEVLQGHVWNPDIESLEDFSTRMRADAEPAPDDKGQPDPPKTELPKTIEPAKNEPTRTTQPQPQNQRK